jgi:hypothetical protein
MKKLLVMIGLAPTLLAGQTGTNSIERGGGPELLIPVVVHIIHYNGAENINDDQVHDALRILNEDFNRQTPNWQSVHPDFLDLVADVGIEFRLAKLDPDGNCTNGITRTVSPLTFSGYQPMRDLIQWPPERYMNVWVHDYQLGIIGGVPPPPDQPVMPAQADTFPASDGVMIRHEGLGSIGTSTSGHSRVITHRVGHWLNLYHPWGPGQEPGIPTNCQEDDEVADTPRTVGSYMCNLNQTTCDGMRDNVENFMDYGQGPCPKMFTLGQKERMLAALNAPIAQRNNLITEQNHALTGMHLPDVLCKADFTSDRRQICVGQEIGFTDMSFHGVVERWWQFPGGTPATSTGSTPIVTYLQPGSHDVILTVTDGMDTITITMNDHVEVLALPGEPVPLTEGFESHDSFDTHPWSLFDPDGDGSWSITPLAATSGLQSARLLNGPDTRGQLDELISPPMDMSGASHMNISFRFAYANRNLDDMDVLRVFTSNDCGMTWQIRASVGAGLLNTGGQVQGDFIPTSDEWGYRAVNNISYPEFTNAVRVKFRFEHNGGNNVYLDDINITGSTVGITEERPDEGWAKIVPNPARDHAHLLVQMPSSGSLAVGIHDATGRQVGSRSFGRLMSGMQRLELPIAGLAPGAYLLRLERQGTYESLRLIIH